MNGLPERRRTLRWRIIAMLLLAALLPLALSAVGAWVVFGRLLERKAIEQQRIIVQSHAAAIESYLAECRDLLQLVADTHARAALVDSARLHAVFADLNRAGNDRFIDLGVIGRDGAHLAYVGPYDLGSRNYRDADWFHEVLAAGAYTSDVFLGFRHVPHFVIAIRVPAASGVWILRATINSDTFDALVHSAFAGSAAGRRQAGAPRAAVKAGGRSVECFLVNRRGEYQSAPAVGAVLDRAPGVPLDDHAGVRDLRAPIDGRERMLVTTWINNRRWLLVVRQDVADVRAPVDRAMTTGAIAVIPGIVLVVLTTVFATRHLTNRIDKADREREEMFQAFMRSAKLASVGELATGLAHEINNPLAVISAEQTNLADLVGTIPGEGDWRDEVGESLARIRRQVTRCAAITSKMLQFGRKREASLESVDVEPRLREIVALLARQAAVRNVELRLDVEPGLPPALLDPIELEQVVVNLLHNAFDAMPAGGRVEVTARRRDGAVLLEVRDTGAGIPPEQLPRIFEPFFTTKPAGQGTGLGLSVCYGIVQSWGGRIEAESRGGEGTTMRIHMPVPQRAAVRA